MQVVHLAAVLGLAAALAILKVVWAVRARLSCMAAMMIAMALGMAVGLLGGVTAGVGTAPDLWLATVTGSVAGVAAGVLAGAAVGIMAVLDGMLSGLMGGMMGAMLGVMAPDKGPPLIAAGSGLLLVTNGLLLVLIVREVGPDRFWPAISHFIGGSANRAGLLLFAIALAFMAGVTAPDRVKGRPGAPAETARLITITATDHQYAPTFFEVVRGEPVRLQFINDGKVEHDLNIAGLNATARAAGHPQGGGNVYARAAPGQRVVVEFIPRVTGIYTAVCTLPGHQEQGMRLQVRGT